MPTVRPQWKSSSTYRKNREYNEGDENRNIRFSSPFSVQRNLRQIKYKIRYVFSGNPEELPRLILPPNTSVLRKKQRSLWYSDVFRNVIIWHLQNTDGKNSEIFYYSWSCRQVIIKSDIITVSEITVSGWDTQKDIGLYSGRYFFYIGSFGSGQVKSLLRWSLVSCAES